MSITSCRLTVLSICSTVIQSDTRWFHFIYLYFSVNYVESTHQYFPLLFSFLLTSNFVLNLFCYPKYDFNIHNILYGFHLVVFFIPHIGLFRSIITLQSLIHPLNYSVYPIVSYTSWGLCSCFPRLDFFSLSNHLALFIVQLTMYSSGSIIKLFPEWFFIFVDPSTALISSLHGNRFNWF